MTIISEDAIQQARDKREAQEELCRSYIKSPRQEAYDEVYRDAYEESRIQERKRIFEIIECEAAEKRPRLAMHYAMNTDTPVDVAVAILQIAPEEQDIPASAQNISHLFWG